MKSAIVRLATAAGLVLLLLPPASAATPDASRSAHVSAAQQLEEVLTLKADVGHGAQLFAICSECHGGKGEGYVSGWPPAIAGQHPRVIAKELVDFRAAVRRYDPMERIAGRHILHTSQDIADIAAYVGSLPAFVGATAEPEKSAGRAATHYESRCASCHGAHGEGSDEKFVPRVAGQREQYLLRQLQDAAQGRRANLRAPHRQLVEDLSPEELAGVAAYMSRLASGAQ